MGLVLLGRWLQSMREGDAVAHPSTMNIKSQEWEYLTRVNEPLCGLFEDSMTALERISYALHHLLRQLITCANLCDRNPVENTKIIRLPINESGMYQQAQIRRYLLI